MKNQRNVYKYTRVRSQIKAHWNIILSNVLIKIFPNFVWWEKWRRKNGIWKSDYQVRELILHKFFLLIFVRSCHLSHTLFYLRQCLTIDSSCYSLHHILIATDTVIIKPTQSKTFIISVIAAWATPETRVCWWRHRDNPWRRPYVNAVIRR